jgi:hypothetical protein
MGKFQGEWVVYVPFNKKAVQLPVATRFYDGERDDTSRKFPYPSLKLVAVLHPSGQGASTQSQG